MLRRSGTRRSLPRNEKNQGRGVKPMDEKRNHAGEFGDTPDDATIERMLTAVRPRLQRALGRIARPRVHVGIVNSPIGRLLIADGPRGLLAVKYLDSGSGDETIAEMRPRFDLIEDPASASQIVGEIEQFLKGDLEAVERRRVDLSLVESDFQRRTLMRLRTVPAGSVVTYASLAAAVGAPSSQRAVGNTMAS